MALNSTYNNGNSVWSKLKYESGAHRVQRIPVTESAGRNHTSTATVVMPEEEDVEIELDPKISEMFIIWCWWPA